MCRYVQGLVLLLNRFPQQYWQYGHCDHQWFSQATPDQILSEVCFDDIFWFNMEYFPYILTGDAAYI